MPISISPLLPTEIPASARLELEAFRSHPRIPMLWRAGYTPDLYAFYEFTKRDGLADPESRYMKAVDDETGQMMAVAEWAFVLDPEKHDREKEPVDPEGRPPGNWPERGNWELRRFFSLNTERWESEWLSSNPYISKLRIPSRRTQIRPDSITELDILVTHPDFAGRGAGSKLLGWGVEQAVKHGVVMALESTPAGLSLYKRFGFREVDVIKADMKQFGWDKPYDEEAAKRVWMIREPQSSN